MKKLRGFTPYHFLTKMMRKATAVPVMTAATTAMSIIVPDPYTPPPPESMDQTRIETPWVRPKISKIQ